MKKSQAAMEYLMTYGWAILIIVIVLAALYAMGIFNPPVSSTCVPVSPFTSCGVKLTGGATGTVTVSAKWPTAAVQGTVTAVSVETDLGTACSLGAVLTSGTQSASINCATINNKKGSSYTGSLVISYIDISGLTQQVSLSIGGKVQ